MKLRPLLLALGLAATATGTVLNADPQAIPDGTAPTADQIGHVFVATCAPGLRPFMEEAFALYETAFRWTATEAGTDAAFAAPEGDILATFDANYAGATCELTVPSAISGDGFAIYEGLTAHLSEKFDTLPEAEAIDGGLKWEWVREGAIEVTYIIEFIETGEGHVLRTQAKQF